MEDMMRSARILAIILMALGAAMVIVGLAVPEELGGSGMHSNEQIAYTFSNVALTGAGGFLLATGLMLFFLREEYQPLSEPVVVPMKDEPEMPVTAAVVGPLPTPTEDDYLVLRLLSGDERTMFRAVVDSGGEALQKDLIVRLKWSDAKVSRVIDRLIEKGVVTKERHGSTNKIRVSVDK
jgi:uncharacterized membrane protein